MDNTIMNTAAFLGSIEVIEKIATDAFSALEAIENEAEGNGSFQIVAALARAARSHLCRVEKETIKIGQQWRAIDDIRVAYENATTALAALKETDEGQALRDLSRDLAVMVEKAARPAFHAITEMQNSVGEIDAMIRSARDMAGCLRVTHDPQRDPNLPEIGSLSATVGEAMDERTVAFAAAIARAKARRLGKSLDAA